MNRQYPALGLRLSKRRQYWFDSQPSRAGLGYMVGMQPVLPIKGAKQRY